MRSQKSKSLIRNTVALALSLTAVWGLNAVLFPVVPSQAEPGSSFSSEVGINVRESIKIAVDKTTLALTDSEGNTQIAPDAAGTLIAGDVNVAVTTNAYKGYTVGVYTADDTKAMKHNNTEVSAVINSIDTVSGYDANIGVADLSKNTWGFRKYTAGTPGNWFAVGANSTSAATIDTKDTPNSEYCDSLEYPLNTSGCAGSTYDTYQVGFGAKLDATLPAGIYTNNIVFSAVTNEGTRYLTFDANAPAGATVSGGMAPKSVFAGSTVTLPAGGFSRSGYGIKGWALTSGATEVASITDGSNTVALTPGATVSVDALSTAAGQSTTATTPIVLYAVWDNQYTLAYIANSPAGAIATGGMSQTEAVLGLDVTLPANGFEVEGYNFRGFAFTSGATAVAQVAGEDLVSGGTFSTSDLITAAAAAGQSVSEDKNGTITLYAVWREPLVAMQDFDCSSLSANEITTLVDSRDNHEYKVKKLPDGKCWMIQNLTLSATDLVTEGKALTSANTNIPASDTNSYYVPPRNTRYATANSITDSAVATASTSVNFDYDYSNHPQVAYKAKGDTSAGNALPEDTAWYPFYTATLGFSYSGDDKSSGSSPRDICPKGWRLPWTSDSGSTRQGSAEFYKLALAYNSDSSIWTNYIAPTSTGSSGPYSSDATIRKNMILGDSGSFDPTLEDNGAAGFTYAGYYYRATLSAVGTYGYYWSSSVYSSGYSYYLLFDTSSVYPQRNNNKYYGYTVRCVAKEPTMQDFDPSSLAEGETATLTDTRDNHKYKVKKLPDGKVWMINNLTLTATDLVTEGKALTSANTNIPSSDTNSYYITPKNARYTSTGGFNNSAVASASEAVNFGTSYPNYIQIGYRDKNTTDNDAGNPVPEDTAYYNFYTATLGYSYYGDGKTSGSSTMDICPKGWRLPHTTDSGTNVTTVDSTNDFTNLARTYNSSASWSGDGPTSYYYYTSDATIRKNMILGDSGSLDPTLEDNGAAGFTYAGYYYGTTLSNVGTYGYYWSSSVYSSGGGYYLRFNTSDVRPQYNISKSNGFAVRCVTGS